MGVRTNSPRKGCVSVCVCLCVSCPILLLSPPLFEVSMRLTENLGQGERRSPDRWEKNKWVFFFSTPSPCCCSLPLCTVVTLSPFLLTFYYLPSRSPINPPPPLLLSSLSRLHFASAAAKQAAIAHRGGETLPFLCLIPAFESLSTALLFFLMIYLSCIHRGGSQQMGGKSIFQQRSYQFVQFTQHPSPPLLFAKIRLCVLWRASITVVYGNNRWLCMCMCLCAWTWLCVWLCNFLCHMANLLCDVIIIWWSHKATVGLKAIPHYKARLFGLSMYGGWQHDKAQLLSWWFSS